MEGVTRAEVWTRVAPGSGGRREWYVLWSAGGYGWTGEHHASDPRDGERFLP